MEKLTFAQYLESKKQLLQAVKETPVQHVSYVVRKYCKIPLGESKDTREYISLKPKQTVKVKWLYEDIENPTPMSVELEHLSEEFDTFWTGEKLDKWLSTNAREIF